VSVPQCCRWLTQPDPTGSVASNRLDHYEAIAAVSREMVAAAREGNWGKVAALEQCCLVRVNRLKEATHVHGLRADEQARRIRLLRSILADDADIHRIAEPWLAQIEPWLLPRSRRPTSPQDRKGDRLSRAGRRVP
jgi:flagellar protein FliT